MSTATLPHTRAHRNRRPWPLVLLLAAAIIGVAATLLVISPWSGSRSASAAFSYQAETIQMADRQRGELRAYFTISDACGELRPTWPEDECERRILATNPGFKPGGYVDGPRILVPGGAGAEPDYGKGHDTIVLGEVSDTGYPAFTDLESACAELRPAWPLDLCVERTLKDPQNREVAGGAYSYGDQVVHAYIPGSAP